MASSDTGKIVCPRCAQRTPAGRRCLPCGAALSAAKLARASDAASSDFGIYLLAIPVIAAFAVLVAALATHQISGVIIVLVVMAIASAGFAVTEFFRAPTAWDHGDPTKSLLGWLAFILILWPAGFPAYLYARRRVHLGNWLIPAAVVESILIAAVIFSGIIIHTGYGKPTSAQIAAQKKQAYPQFLRASPHWIPDPGDVGLVKTSYLDNCKQRTVEQEVNAYLGAPRWEAGADTQGRDFVNVGGTVTYHGKPVPAVFQFLIDPDKRGFKYHAFTINGVPQTIYVAALTLMEMCAAANRAPMILVPQDPGAS